MACRLAICLLPTFNSVISFHSFPLNKETRKKWLQNIQREDCEVSPNIRVCSRHFRTDDFIEQSTPTSRRLLKKGAVPTLFTRSSSPVRTGLWRRRRVLSPLKQDPVPTGFQHQEHDYCSSLVQDHLEVDETEVLRKEVERLKRQVALSVLQSGILQITTATKNKPVLADNIKKIKCHKCTKSTFKLLFLNIVRKFTSYRLFYALNHCSFNLFFL
uniref:THAP domain-containing protein 1 n=1 Tax=Cyprinus carpio TaxID=7962 RepID=A0A8C2EUT3_CYPCA